MASSKEFFFQGIKLTMRDQMSNYLIYHKELHITCFYLLTSKGKPLYFKVLNLIKTALQVKIVIKFQSLNFKASKVIPWIPCSSKPSFLVIKVFMRGRVCDVNRINIIAPSIRICCVKSLTCSNSLVSFPTCS